MRKNFFLLLAVTFCLPNLSYANVNFGEYAKFEFAPARGETFLIPIRLEKPASLEISIFTSDGDLVRTLRTEQVLKPGTHTLTWDGKDKDGVIVPNEAYVPVLKFKQAGGKEQSIDPRDTSGGEVVENLHVQITPTKDISYFLPTASRVLIRAGIKGGPMLRSLANWAPRGPGKNVQRWNGRDQNGIMDIRAEKKLGLFVIAFQLPKYSIITTGNKTTDYRAYRQTKDWQNPEVRPEKMVLAKGNRRISRQYYFPRAQDAMPKVTLSLPDNLPLSPAGYPQVKLGQFLLVKTDIAKEDRWLMNESLYEVAFFVDHVFVAEEEQGYVPLTWYWKVHNLTPGRHILTVNISGFSGKVGVSSLLFEVQENK
jgi:hypothetical protein